jgi:L-proline amide hydrolase
MFKFTIKEGTIDFHENQTWYRVVSSNQGDLSIPILCLHGGPGSNWDYLQPFEDLANDRNVIFYDQIGGGNSAVTRPHNPEMWTIDLFIEELESVRAALGLHRCHILGQSWGGMLAMEYLLRKPSGVVSLTLESSPASMVQWASEIGQLVDQLPSDIKATLSAHEAAGTTNDIAYQEAVLVFYRRHLCRTIPWPDFVERSFTKLTRNSEVYHYMNGPSEFYVTGSLKSWSIIDRLKEISAPTLILSGRYDEATPLISETVNQGIRGSKWILFENSSHMCHVEERDRCMRVVRDFLHKAEL